MRVVKGRGTDRSQVSKTNHYIVAVYLQCITSRIALNILLPVTLRTAYRFYTTLARRLTQWENYKHQARSNLFSGKWMSDVIGTSSDFVG